MTILGQLLNHLLAYHSIVYLNIIVLSTILTFNYLPTFHSFGTDDDRFVILVQWSKIPLYIYSNSSTSFELH